jgi:hypothetical protein
MGCLLAFLGWVAGALVGIALTFALLVGAEADALTWLASFVFFGFVGGALGATAGAVWHDRRRKNARPS